MKLSSLLCCALPTTILLFASCSKNNTNPSNNNNSNNSNNWNWSGTAPLSVKLDGKLFVADLDTSGVTDFDSTGLGALVLWGQKKTSDSIISISFLKGSTGVQAGEYSTPTTNIQLQSTDNEVWLMASLPGGSGKTKVTSITTKEIEGLFYGTLADQDKAAHTLEMKDGYFKFDLTKKRLK